MTYYLRRQLRRLCNLPLDTTNSYLLRGEPKNGAHEVFRALRLLNICQQTF